MFSRILYVLSAGYFGYVIYKNYNFLGNIPAEIHKANFLLILFALILQVGKYFLLAYNFQLNFEKVGIKFKFLDTVKATLTYVYVCVSTPFVGAGGLLAFVNFAQKKSVSKIKVAAGSFLALLADYLGFFLLILTSLFLFNSTLEDFPVNYLISLLIFGSALISIVFLSIFRKDFLTYLIKKAQDLANFFSQKIHKKNQYDEDWARRNVNLAHECFVDIKKDPKFYFKSVMVGLLFHFINVLTLGVVALSFSERLTISKITSTYIVLNTLETVSPTPNGIGIIESVVPEYMTTLGIDFSNSLIVISIFRFIYFYIPLFIGFYYSYKIFQKKK